MSAGLLRVLFALNLTLSSIGFAGMAFAAEVPGLQAFRFTWAVVGSLSLEPSANDQLKTRILQHIKTQFKNQGSEIKLESWPNARGFKKAVYIDPTGRRWEVMPAQANTSGFDGVSLQSPFLGRSDIKTLLSPALGGLKKTRLLSRGIRSTTEVTVTLPDEDYSTRVDRILFIESHWPEIYQAFSPHRSGTGTIEDVVEWPLAVDSPLLLRELAALAPHERTSANIKSLFKKHQIEGSPWEGRAADYSAYLGIGTESKPQIIFRIPDLVYSPSDVLKKSDFLYALSGTSALLQASEKTPNRLNPEVISEDTVMLEIEKAQNPSEHRNFLASLKLDEKSFDYRKGSSKALRSSRVSLHDPFSPLAPFFSPIAVDGIPFTFGFEAEFAAEENYMELLKPNRTTLVDTEKFPFLEPKLEQEDEGNSETKSKGGETTLAEVEHQMKLVKSVLGRELKGFHFRVRVPNSALARIPEADLHAWFGLISDSIMAWRLENRQTKYALKTYSQRRFELTEPDNRSTLRVIKVENSDFTDIEIRGYMGEIPKIITTARQLIAGISRPELIATNFNEQRAIRHSEKSETLEKWMERFASTFHKRPLTKVERKTARDLSADLVISYEEEGGGIYQNQELPLFHFERLGFLTPLERQRIDDANFEFSKQSWNVIQRRLSGEYATQNEANIQYRDRIRRWSQAARLHDILTSAALIRPAGCNFLETL
jgi:hypothetical protein